MAIGSDLINTSANGQPNDNEDRPFSFAIGTQLWLVGLIHKLVLLLQAVFPLGSGD